MHARGGVRGISVRLLNPHVFPPGSDTTANKRARVSLHARAAGHFHASAATDRYQTAGLGAGGILVAAARGRCRAQQPAARFLLDAREAREF